MKKQENGREAVWLTLGAALCKGGALAAVLTLGLALAGAAAISLGVLEEHWQEGAVLACCVLGSFGGGLLSVRCGGRSPLPLGLGTGALLFLLLLTLGGLSDPAISPGKGAISILTACLCGGGGAGILARPPKKKRRR